MIRFSNVNVCAKAEVVTELCSKGRTARWAGSCDSFWWRAENVQMHTWNLIWDWVTLCGQYFCQMGAGMKLRNGNSSDARIPSMHLKINKAKGMSQQAGPFPFFKINTVTLMNRVQVSSSLQTASAGIYRPGGPSSPEAGCPWQCLVFPLVLCLLWLLHCSKVLFLPFCL